MTFRDSSISVPTCPAGNRPTSRQGRRHNYHPRDFCFDWSNKLYLWKQLNSLVSLMVYRLRFSTQEKGECVSAVALIRLEEKGISAFLPLQRGTQQEEILEEGKTEIRVSSHPPCSVILQWSYVSVKLFLFWLFVWANWNGKNFTKLFFFFQVIFNFSSLCTEIMKKTSWEFHVSCTYDSFG